jgi:hypothetical protein
MSHDILDSSLLSIYLDDTTMHGQVKQQWFGGEDSDGQREMGQGELRRHVSQMIYSAMIL